MNHGGAEAFKSVMRHFPTGVAVVTSLRDGEPRGVTVNAFAGVSLDPPTVLICINREARSYLYISSSKLFCVNFLAGDQRHLAERFAGKLRERQFEDIPYYIDISGAPVLEGTVGHLDCQVVEEHAVESHSIFIGRVVGSASRGGSPLGYYNSAYHDFGIRID
ncbi:MAG: flavin reductase family protein [Candidatus Eremiobacteraeota bacterium]|nr:flavin reductase family protein [Candidatus Eremiobacteraeota bacterium]